MKCLSIRQPWADLIISGKRSLEIRKWPTKYRGKLLIHAPLKVEQDECERLSIPVGCTSAIIGVAELVDVKKLSELEWSKMRHLHLEAGSRCYRGETFAWFLKNPEKFAQPIPFKGRLGLFEVLNELKTLSVSDDIYVPTIGDFFVGGLAKVIMVIGDNQHYVAAEEHNGASYRWENGIALMQEELKIQFGRQRAYSTGIERSCPIKS